jgi:hypothetical protein
MRKVQQHGATAAARKALAPDHIILCALAPFRASHDAPVPNYEAISGKTKPSDKLTLWRC